MNKRIISFSGRKHSGKTLLSELLQKKYNYQILYFADGLKKLICDLMNINRNVLDSMKDIQQEINLKDKITIVSKRLGLEHLSIDELKRFEIPFTSIREILQFLGTEIIRKYCPRWHIEQLEKNMTGNLICIGDCRFPDEKEFVEQMGGETWIIVRPNYFDDISNHSSETSLQWKMFGERVIINNKDLETLKKTWCNYIETGKWQPSSFIYKQENDIFGEQYFMSFLKNSTTKNAKRMACLIENPLILEDLKLFI
jgi:hypothetical protein